MITDIGYLKSGLSPNFSQELNLSNKSSSINESDLQANQTSLKHTTYHGNITHDIKEVQDTEEYLNPSTMENDLNTSDDAKNDESVTQIIDTATGSKFGTIYGTIEDNSLMYDSAMYDYIRGNIDNEIKIAGMLKNECGLNESVVMLEARLQDSVKQRWEKFIDFNNKIDSRFYASMNKILVDQHDYLEKYQDIILNKKPREDMEYEYTGDYAEGIDRCMNTPLPVFNYERDAEWLRQDGYEGAIKNFMSGKNFKYDKDKSLEEQFKSWFIAGERGVSKGKFSNLNMKSIFDFCYNWQKIEQVIKKDQQMLSQSTTALINAVNKELRERGEDPNKNVQDNTQKSTTTNGAKNTQNQTTNNSQKAGMGSNGSTTTINEGGIWLEANDQQSNNTSKTDLSIKTNTVNKMDENGNSKQTEVKAAGEANTTTQDINNIQRKWIALNKALLTAKKTALQQIAKDYMNLIRAHVRSYGGNSIKKAENEDANKNDTEAKNESASYTDLDLIGYYASEQSVFDEGVIDNIKEKMAQVAELKAQWKSVADKFVKHKWIYRYIYDDKQEEMLKKYYTMLTDEEVAYGQYKRAFKFISKFMGLPADKIIIENLVFKHDTKDKEQKIVALMYSKGLAKVTIPKGVNLIHVSPADNITALNPTFRSKVKGRYMYPTKRCFFTVIHDIKPTQAGLEKTKTTRYTPTGTITNAYIDPTYSDFKDGSIYIETDSPISVKKFEKKMLDVFSKKEDSAVKAESTLTDYESEIDPEMIDESFKEFIDNMKNWKTANQAHQKKVFKSDALTNDEYEKIKGIIEELKDPKTEYEDYKKAFDKLCRFCHIVPRGTIITKYELKKGSNDNNNSLHVEYSDNTKKIQLPSGVKLYHLSPVANIKQLIPQFRGKSEKGYLYDKPRIYFTINKNMPKFLADYKASTKVHKYMCKKDISSAYVDPLVWSSVQGAVYIETNKPIEVDEVGIPKKEDARDNVETKETKNESVFSADEFINFVTENGLTLEEDLTESDTSFEEDVLLESEKDDNLFAYFASNEFITDAIKGDNPKKIRKYIGKAEKFKSTIDKIEYRPYKGGGNYKKQFVTSVSAKGIATGIVSKVAYKHRTKNVTMYGKDRIQSMKKQVDDNIKKLSDIADKLEKKK